MELRRSSARVRMSFEFIDNITTYLVEAKPHRKWSRPSRAFEAACPDEGRRHAGYFERYKWGT